MQILVPALVDLIEMSLKILVQKGYNRHAASMEMYASGEIGKMLLDGARLGLDNVISEYGSPICQAGYFRHRNNMFSSLMGKKAQKILDDIENREFSEWFNVEMSKGYTLVKDVKKTCSKKELNQIHLQTQKLFKHLKEKEVEPDYSPSFDKKT